MEKGALATQGASEVMDLAYGRNAKGLITSLASSAGADPGNDAARSWTYAYDELDRLITADNGNGTGDDRSYAYDDADNMVWNSGLCAGSASSPNLLYPDGNGASPGQGLSSGRPCPGSAPVEQIA